MKESSYSSNKLLTDKIIETEQRKPILIDHTDDTINQPYRKLITQYPIFPNLLEYKKNINFIFEIMFEHPYYTYNTYIHNPTNNTYIEMEIDYSKYIIPFLKITYKGIKT